MRICLYQTTPRGGLAFYGHCLAESLGKAGHEVELLTTSGYIYRSNYYHSFPVMRGFGSSSNRVLRKLASLWAYWVHITTLVRRVRQAKVPYDVVHIQLPYIVLHWLFVPLLRRHCKVVVGTIHDVIPHQPVLHPKVDMVLSQWTFAKFDRLIVHSDENCRQLLETFRIDKARVSVVPHGVFHYGPAPCTPGESRPAQGELRVLFFGAIRRNKGLHVLLGSLLKVSGISVRLVIAGAGTSADVEMVRHFERGWETLGLRHKVVWENRFVEDNEIPALFTETDVVVLPYTSFASQSGVLNVAIGYEKPVIVTDVGSLGATVRTFGNGVVVQAGDVDGLAQAIVQVDPARSAYAQMVVAAQAARGALDWDTIAQQTVDQAYADS